MYNKNKRSLIISLFLITIVIVDFAVFFINDEGSNLDKKYSIDQKANSVPIEINKDVVEKNSSTTSTSWKIYRSESAGIEFQYPSDWEVDTQHSFDRYNSISLTDLSHIDHTLLDYDNMSIEKQYEQIKCKKGDYYLVIECKNRVSSFGAKYVWKVDLTPGGPWYGVLVPTGKYILAINFQDKSNYELKKDDYQKMLSTLKIIK
jgi:hypothetical protein